MNSLLACEYAQHWNELCVVVYKWSLTLTVFYKWSLLWLFFRRGQHPVFPPVNVWYLYLSCWSVVIYMLSFCIYVYAFLYCWSAILIQAFIFVLFGCRVDVVLFVIWELVILAFFVFSAVSLYFRHLRLAFILVCITLLLLLCMKITKQVRLARKKKRRMLLPLSM